MHYGYRIAGVAILAVNFASVAQPRDPGHAPRSHGSDVGPSPLWTTIGPSRISGNLGTLASGKLQALAIHFSNRSVIYAAGGLGSGGEGPLTGAGAFKTTDGGAGWASINNGLFDSVVNVLWVDQTNPNIVMAGTENAGIFKSVDGGQTWGRTAGFGSTSELVSTADGTILAATAAGIAQSNDSGTTWKLIQSTASPVRALATGGGVTIAGLKSGAVLMQSAPNAAWQTVLNSGHEVPSVAIDPSSPTIAYAVVGCCPGALFGTSNGGLTWAAVTAPTGPQAVAMSPASHLLYLAGNGSMFSTSNTGQTWTAIANAAFDIRKIFLAPDDSAAFIGTDQGLYETLNRGSTWVSLSGTASSSILTAVAVRGSTVLTAVQDFGGIVSFDAGTSWQQQSTGPAGEDGTVLINAANPASCYAYTTLGYQYSMDGCHTFRFTTATGLGVSSYVQPGGVNIVAVDPVTPSRVYAASQSGVFMSVDSGVTMTPTNWALTQATAIAVDGRTIYVGTTSGLFQTLDGGATWTRLSLAGAAGYPTTIALDPRDSHVVLVGLSQGPARGGGVLKSTNTGSSFRLVNAGLPVRDARLLCCGVDILAVRFSPESGLALATTTGAYVSTDIGEHWQDITADSVPTYVSDVAWDGDYLYAATFGGGVLRAAKSSLLIPALRAPSPPAGLSAAASGNSVTLTWNAPPSGSAPSTYVIEAGSSSDLSDLARVSTGSPATTFSASGVAAGTYFVRVRANNTAGTSAPSNEVSISVGCQAPPSPSGLRATAGSGGAVTLTWNSGGASATSYVIEAGTSPGAASIVSDTGSPATSLTTVAGPGTYYVRVRSRNACGTSGPSNEVTVVVGAASPHPSKGGGSFNAAPLWKLHNLPL